MAGNVFACSERQPGRQADDRLPAGKCCTFRPRPRMLGKMDSDGQTARRLRIQNPRLRTAPVSAVDLDNRHLPNDAGGFEPSHSHDRGAAEPRVDPQLVQQTKLEIRNLVHQITRLSQSEIPPERFFDEFLQLVVAALAAPGGAVWRASPVAAAGSNISLRLQSQVNLAQVGLLPEPQSPTTPESHAAPQTPAGHTQLLQSTAAGGKAVAVDPRTQLEATDSPSNPTAFLLLLAPIPIDVDGVAVVEIFQRPGGGPVTRRGYLRFLTQMCELAAEFFRQRRLRVLTEQRQWWQSCERFVQSIHRQLDSRKTATAVCNDGCRLIGADRVTVVIRRGQSWRVAAISGLDSWDKHSETVERLAGLCKTVAACRETLWFDATGAPDEFAPQIHWRLQQYVDSSHARALGMLPCVAPADTDEAGISARTSANASDEKPFAMILVERFADARFPKDIRGRAAAVRDLATPALNNARQHECLPMLPLLRTMAAAYDRLRTTARAKTLLAIVICCVAVLALVFIPMELKVRARGHLLPADCRNVFAQVAGTVNEVPVENGQLVDAGQPLVTLQNFDLEREHSDLLGRIATNRQRMLAIQSTLLKQPDLAPGERSRLTSEFSQREESAASMLQQKKLLDRKLRELVIRSPIAGQIVTWQVADELRNKPVAVGERLLTVVNPQGDWELEVRVRDRDLRHVLNREQPGRHAMATAANHSPRVSFALATLPGRQFTGRLLEIQPAVEEGESGDGWVRLQVAVDKRQLPELRPNVAVDARVHCGTRPLGYVWLRDLIDTVHAAIAFYL